MNWISDYLPLVLIVVFVIGYLAIFMHYWSRTLGYLENIVSATEQIYRSGDDPISLPEDLREVEIQMNRIKADMLASRLAARGGRAAQERPGGVSGSRPEDAADLRHRLSHAAA